MHAGLRAFLFISAFTVLSGFGSCSRTVEKACHEELPGFIQKLAQASQDLKTDRTIASSAPEERRKRLLVWQEWSVERLQEVQLYHDLTEDFPQLAEARKNLSEAANELVAFYGFAQKGQQSGMVQAVNKIHKHARSAASISCPAAGK